MAETELCQCGHAIERHDIEPPYPCYDCDCSSCTRFTPPTEASEQTTDSSGQNWPIKSESAKDLIMELEPLKPTGFDWAEIKTLRALVVETETLQARVALAVEGLNRISHGHYSAEASDIADAVLKAIGELKPHAKQ